MANNADTGERQRECQPLPWHAEDGSFYYVIDAAGEVVAMCNYKKTRDTILRNSAEGVLMFVPLFPDAPRVLKPA